MNDLPNEMLRYILMLAKDIDSIRFSITNKIAYSIFRSLPRREGSSLRDLIVSRIEFNDDNLYYLIKRGQLKLIKPFIERGFSWDKILISAARVGDVDLALCALRNSAISLHQAFAKAYKNGHKHMEYLFGIRMDDNICFHCDHDMLLKHVQAHKNPMFCYKVICKHGQLKSFKLLYAYGIQKNIMLYYLGKYNRYDILNWLREIGEPVSDNEIMGACKGACVYILRAYIANGGVITEKHYINICKSESSKLMRFYYNSTFSIDKILEVLAAKGRYGMIRWIFTKRIIEPNFLHLAMRAACRHGREKICIFLLSHGAIWEDTYYKDICCSGNSDMMETFLSIGKDAVNEGFVETIHHRSYQGVKLLIKHSHCSKEYMIKLAAKKHRDKILRFLVDR